mmetsp:Transcript_136656/g.436673  ORF Transcript_136656/g.436673 Transcript_136656/m.436673 type:complete len:273 (+) Transcript_136656:66-884(+)
MGCLGIIAATRAVTHAMGPCVVQVLPRKAKSHAQVVELEVQPALGGPPQRDLELGVNGLGEVPEAGVRVPQVWRNALRLDDVGNLVDHAIDNGDLDGRDPSPVREAQPQDQHHPDLRQPSLYGTVHALGQTDRDDQRNSLPIEGIVQENAELPLEEPDDPAERVQPIQGPPQVASFVDQVRRHQLADAKRLDDLRRPLENDALGWTFALPALSVAVAAIARGSGAAAAFAGRAGAGAGARTDKCLGRTESPARLPTAPHRPLRRASLRRRAR